jgi:hypothetical protein
MLTSVVASFDAATMFAARRVAFKVAKHEVRHHFESVSFLRA